jgi:hypothetical protein
MFNLTPNKMEKRSFAIGLAIASVIWIGTMCMYIYAQPSTESNVEPHVVYGYPPHSICDTLVVGDTLLQQQRVIYFERGYFTCLREAHPRMYTAYILGVHKLKGVEDQEVIDSVVFDLAICYRFSEDEREYLYTLITD